MPSSSAGGIERWLDDIARFASGPSSSWAEMERKPTNEREAARQSRVRRNLADADEINAGLARLGIPFGVSQLAAVRAPYPEAIPLLLEHLAKNHNDDVIWSIIRALNVRYGGRELFEGVYRFLQYYRDERSAASPDGMSSELAFTIGETLAEIADKNYIPQLERIVNDDANGAAVIMPLHRLAKWKNATVGATAKRMLDRKNRPFAAVKALRIARVRDASEYVRPYLQHADGEMRAEARKYFTMLEKYPDTPANRNA